MSNSKFRGDLASNSFSGGKLRGDLSFNGSANGDIRADSNFKTATDLSTTKVENKRLNSYTETEMREYLASVVSGKRYKGATAEGRMFASFGRVVDMVEDGDNIVDATYYNPDMIEIEFQRFEKALSEMKGKMR